MKEKYFLDYALAEKKITKADLTRYEQKLKEEMTSLEVRLDQLRNAMGAASTKIAQVVKSAGNEIPTPFRKARRKVKKATAEVMASRKLQGHYISALRSLPKSKRAKFAAIAKEKGREAAIREIKKTSAEL
jgi:hypothetical protein